ncbi:MAG: hypothetical protein ACK2UY_14580 [Anaerolineae bacterium]|jgi:cephalosporin-C deacetylase-like acetyl esterase
MNAHILFGTQRRYPALVALGGCLLLLLAAVVVAWLVQRAFGNVEVRNARFDNANGIPIRAKLQRPVAAVEDSPLPGAVYAHGYQNNRETNDPYCIEMARRGVVMLCIDAIGRAPIPV